MDSFTSFVRSDAFLYILAVGFIIVLVLYIVNCMKLNKIKKNYNSFMKKVGNGSNIEESLKRYIGEVEAVSDKNKEIAASINKLNNDLTKCIKKIGIIRYSAFKDTGSDLSFALALLNDENTGIVLNGIYSAEASNIYAKSVNRGKSSYTISDEEKQAINMAINSEETHKIIEC